VLLFLKRQCDRTLRLGCHAPGGRGEAADGGGEIHREQVRGRAGPCEDEGGRVLREDCEGGLGAAFRSTVCKLKRRPVQECTLQYVYVPFEVAMASTRSRALACGYL
jgi:hypothetical protein